MRVTSEPVVAQGIPQIIGGTLAPLFFASSGQINFLMPPVPLGPATITVTTADGGTFSATIDIARVAPALFSADASGSGVAAAQFLRVAADGKRTQDLIFDPNTLAAVPIDLGSTQDQVFLLLFGTGIRGFTSEVTATVIGTGAVARQVALPVLGAVPQGEFEGVDQVNIGPLPRSLQRGVELVLVLTVDGRQTNPLFVVLKPSPLLPSMPGPVSLDVKPDPSRRALEIQPQKPRFAGRAK